jgi:hypothetical protein
MLAAGSAALLAGAAFAGKPGSQPLPSLAQCAASDIIGAQVLNCTGFLDKNLLNNANATQDMTILAALGYNDWSGQFANPVKIDNLNGSKTLDFGVKLTGISYIAVHYGAGVGGPGNGTAFYVLDAAQGINQLHLAYDASSSAILFATEISDHVIGVPEPASWATMIAGFGLIGALMRRRRRSAAAA